VYSIKVNGTPVTGSPITVAAGDNTAYFESTAGTVSFGAACTITTTTLPNGVVGSAYSQTVGTSNCVSPITWTISAGTLCTNLTLGSSTGTISGTPSTPQTCSFTVQAVDSTPTTVTQALSITTTSTVGTISPARAGSSGVAGTVRH